MTSRLRTGKIITFFYSVELGGKYSWGREVQLNINLLGVSIIICFGVVKKFRKKYEKKSQESM